MIYSLPLINNAMKFLSKLFTYKVTIILAPHRFLGFDNIHTWMKEKAAYFAGTYPDKLFYLFCPSLADYFPLGTVTK